MGIFTATKHVAVFQGSTVGIVAAIGVGALLPRAFAVDFGRQGAARHLMASAQHAAHILHARQIPSGHVEGQSATFAEHVPCVAQVENLPVRQGLLEGMAPEKHAACFRQRRDIALVHGLVVHAAVAEHVRARWRQLPPIDGSVKGRATVEHSHHRVTLGVDDALVHRLIERGAARKHAIHLAHSREVPSVQRLVEGDAVAQHGTGVCHMIQVPRAQRLVEQSASIEHVTEVVGHEGVPATQVAVELAAMFKHAREVATSRHVPVADVAVESMTPRKHARKLLAVAHIPSRQIGHEFAAVAEHVGEHLPIAHVPLLQIGAGHVGKLEHALKARHRPHLP